MINSSLSYNPWCNSRAVTLSWSFAFKCVTECQVCIQSVKLIQRVPQLTRILCANLFSPFLNIQHNRKIWFLLGVKSCYMVVNISMICHCREGQKRVCWFLHTLYSTNRSRIRISSSCLFLSDPKEEDICKNIIVIHFLLQLICEHKAIFTYTNCDDTTGPQTKRGQCFKLQGELLHVILWKQLLHAYVGWLA